MHFFRLSLVVAILIGFTAGDLQAQKKKKTTSDDGYIPQVLPESKQKKKKEDETQKLPLPKEPPSAVTADTDRLAFQVSPLSPKGLLSQQIRDALRTLLRTSHGTILQMRAFVAGSGDLRRVGEITGEMFSEKHLPLPALSVVQVGALPLEGAQVIIETTEADKKVVNPKGVAFLSGQAAPNVAQSLDHLKTGLRGAGLEPADVLRATCFISSLDQQRNTRDLMSASFPGAVLNYVQMQREPVTPASECEAVARLRTVVPEGMSFLNPPNLDKSPNYSQIALVSSAKLVITGTQLAFGGQEGDLKLAFGRLEKALSSLNARFDRVVMSHVYLMSSNLINSVRTVRAGYYTGKHPPASTMLPFEGLPSLDSQMGVDVIAVLDSSGTQR